jgi:translation initiation factor IF-3
MNLKPSVNRPAVPATEELRMGPSLRPSGAYPSRRPFPRRETGPRKNDRIRVPEVRVIGPEGQQLGVMSTRQALEKARQWGLDLVEVAPSAQPPVCRIVEFGKYMYEESKKNKSNKKNVTKVKEIKLRLNIDTHDLETKLRQAEGFFEKGYKVKVTLNLKGREMEQKALALERVRQLVVMLKAYAQTEGEPKLMGRNIYAHLNPLPSLKRKPAGAADDADDADQEEDTES